MADSGTASTPESGDVDRISLLSQKIVEHALIWGEDDDGADVPMGLDVTALRTLLDEFATADFHHAENAEERGEGICRTCLAPIWYEVGEVGHRELTDWSDRIKRGGDSLVCFRAVHYRHVPLDGREAAIYDRAYKRGAGAEEVSDA